ncbi:DUF1851 domain-containing protein [Knoellia locipacati]|uniref:T6SS immunity protein Tdi1 domain-containing protein n=1 Tax=Knoellia locipacati TaxID=882824 RepID=UPI00384B73E1
MELIRRFDAGLLAQGLEDWSWLPDLSGKAPVATSAFGDVFLEGDDGVWFLDTMEGRLTREWDSTAALQEQLNTVEGQDQYLLAGLVEAAHESGLEPSAEQVLSFKVAPVLGGEIEVVNVEVTDLVVALSIAGQIHRQVKDLPPGTPISGITVDDA